MSSIFTPVIHPRIVQRQKERPTKVVDQLPKTGHLARFNSFLAVKITNGVGTMWCAYVFAGIALVSLPSVLKTGDVVTIVAWVAQTFLQLVLLSIIIVGQNIQAAASDKRAEATFNDADAVLHTAVQIQKHLGAQDAVLERLLKELIELKTASTPPPPRPAAPA